MQVTTCPAALQLAPAGVVNEPGTRVRPAPRVSVSVVTWVVGAAATVTATTKFARLGKARVIPFTQERLADGSGYRVVVHPPLDDFPGESEEADCLRLNQWIEAAIRRHPEQYLWAHRRFKTRPEGEPKLYKRVK